MLHGKYISGKRVMSFERFSELLGTLRKDGWSSKHGYTDKELYSDFDEDSVLTYYSEGSKYYGVYSNSCTNPDDIEVTVECINAPLPSKDVTLISTITGVQYFKDFSK